MTCVSKPVLRLSKGGLFAALRDSAERFPSANGVNKTINELNSLFNFVRIPQSRSRLFLFNTAMNEQTDLAGEAIKTIEALYKAK
ncbi:hypothetical protein [Legionella nautarum]|uniref:hypothetical protein n=1 Tax=Legionella nautarum TaxID=45070 RepID=UPI001056BFD7|nr:hypothetical protein [Legionella nautarum]